MTSFYLINHTKRQYAYVGDAEGESVTAMFRLGRWTLNDNITLNVMDSSDQERYADRGFVMINDLQRESSESESSRRSSRRSSDRSGSDFDSEDDDTFTSYTYTYDDDDDEDDVTTLVDPTERRRVY